MAVLGVGSFFGVQAWLKSTKAEEPEAAQGKEDKGAAQKRLAALTKKPVIVAQPTPQPAPATGDKQPMVVRGTQAPAAQAPRKTEGLPADLQRRVDRAQELGQQAAQAGSDYGKRFDMLTEALSELEVVAKELLSRNLPASSLVRRLKVAYGKQQLALAYAETESGRIRNRNRIVRDINDLHNNLPLELVATKRTAKGRTYYRYLTKGSKRFYLTIELFGEGRQPALNIVACQIAVLYPKELSRKAVPHLAQILHIVERKDAADFQSWILRKLRSMSQRAESITFHSREIRLRAVPLDGGDLLFLGTAIDFDKTRDPELRLKLEDLAQGRR